MANVEQKRGPGVVLWIVVAAVVVGLVFLVRSLTREKVEVRVAPVTHQNLLSTVSTNGIVQPVQVFQAHAAIGGTVEKIYTEVNEHVSAGAPLIHMNDAEAKARVASAQALLAAAELSRHDISAGGTIEEKVRFQQDIGSAQAEERNASADLATVAALQARGAASEGEVLRARQRVQTAQLSVRNAQARNTGRFGAEDRSNVDARVNDARAALNAAQAALAAVDIHSPISGTVYYMPVAAYDSVTAGEDMMDIADLNRIQVQAYFDEPEIGKLARGQAVRIVWDARPGQIWHGHVERAPTTVIKYGTRNVGECLITVDDAKGDLLPNTNVTVTVTVSQRFNTLSIPREALHTEGSTDFVYRIVNGQLARATVQIGVVNLTSVEVRGGLTENDVVVLGPTQPGHDLANGLAVKRAK